MSKQFSAMALLGTEAGKPFEDFNSLLSKITSAANMLIMTTGHDNVPPSLSKWHATIWDGYGDGPDEVNAELDRIAQAVEAMCRPSLSAKAPALSDISADQLKLAH